MLNVVRKLCGLLNREAGGNERLPLVIVRFGGQRALRLAAVEALHTTRGGAEDKWGAIVAEVDEVVLTVGPAGSILVHHGMCDSK